MVPIPHKVAYIVYLCTLLLLTKGSWVVNDANTLEKELDRITGKNGLAAMLPQPAPKPLRIKLSLKELKSFLFRVQFWTQCITTASPRKKPR